MEDPTKVEESPLIYRRWCRWDRPPSWQLRYDCACYLRYLCFSPVFFAHGAQGFTQHDFDTLLGTGQSFSLTSATELLDTTMWPREILRDESSDPKGPRRRGRR